MRGSIAAQGTFTAIATINDDGSLTVALLDAQDRTLAIGQWEAPEPAQEQEVTSWQSQRRAS